MRRDHRGREVYDLVSTSEAFATELMEYCDWFTSVPDSVFKKTLARLVPYFFSSRENHAVAMAFGALAGGKRPCVLIQNSGLGLAIDALLGLFRLYGQGLLMIVSHRGELAWEEVQHHVWGGVTIPLLEAMGITVIDFQKWGMAALREASEAAYRNGKVVALLVHRGNLDE